MDDLEQRLDRVREHRGVEQAILVGRDGLLIQRRGNEPLDAVDTVCAMVPGLLAAADALGESASQGEAATVAVELREGVALLSVISDDIVLAVLLRPGVGFAPLLAELRSSRERN